MLLARIFVQVVELVVVGGRIDPEADELPGPDAGSLAVAPGELEIQEIMLRLLFRTAFQQRQEADAVHIRHLGIVVQHGAESRHHGVGIRFCKDNFLSRNKYVYLSGHATCTQDSDRLPVDLPSRRFLPGRGVFCVGQRAGRTGRVYRRPAGV